MQTKTFRLCAKKADEMRVKKEKLSTNPIIYFGPKTPEGIGHKPNVKKIYKHKVVKSAPISH